MLCYLKRATEPGKATMSEQTQRVSSIIFPAVVFFGQRPTFKRAVLARAGKISTGRGKMNRDRPVYMRALFPASIDLP